jgi:putative SOS response-associated peptidase YedK
MCGRFRLTRRDREIREHFDIADEYDWKPRYNIAPTDIVPVVRQDPKKPMRTLSGMRWGLIPYWSKDAKNAARMINARSETVAEMPAYRDSFERRRCLIPADGFYEWKRGGKAKQPFNFSMKDNSIFGLAGIWDRWKNPAGEVIESCSILTTAPNALLADIHDRMPVIMQPDSYDLWLDPGFKNAAELSGLLIPFDPSPMKRYAVSSHVNSVKNDDPECSEAVESTLCIESGQKDLFT